MYLSHPVLAVAGVVALSAVFAAGSPASPTASPAALHRCHVGQKESETFGPTYVTSISKSGVTCTAAKRVVRAFHRCRKAHGGTRGRCPTTTSVRGFHCREKRGGIKTEFSGKVTCTSGHRRVVHTYTQIT